MHTLDSVIALAHFELTDQTLSQLHQKLVNEKDWQTWINQVELHSLSGFAHKHISEHALPIPEQVFDLLEQLKVRHTKAANVRHQTLRELGSCFEERNISMLGLKGVALAQRLYTDDYLRPMRDMDILVKRSDLEAAAMAIESVGYKMPNHHPSVFMQSMHQLPNATKMIDGMTSSVEIHHDGISREVPGHFYYPESQKSIQRIQWRELSFDVLEDVEMLHQVTRHLEGLHSAAILKLINVMDVIGLSHSLIETPQWSLVERKYPHVINTLRCLHMLTPLPSELAQITSGAASVQVNGVGKIMGSLRAGVKAPSWSQKFKALFLPSDWWMYLHYNVDPNKSLNAVKWVRHPLRVLSWFFDRFTSYLHTRLSFMKGRVVE